MQIRCERTIPAPPEVVWEVVTDLDGAPANIRGIDAVERLEGPAFGVGTKWRETRTMMGREATEEMWLTAVDEKAGYTAEAASHGMRYRTRFDLEPTEAGTRLVVSFDGEPQTFASRLMGATLGRLFMGATRKALEQDLADIDRAATARA